MKCICICIADDGTYTVHPEEYDAPPEGAQQFASEEELMAALPQMLSADAMPEEGDVEMEGEAETKAMNAAFEGGFKGARGGSGY
jgi:hypothetical protein